MPGAAGKLIGNKGGQHKKAYQQNLYNLYTFSSYFLHN
jgi:hypothetical protein